VELLPIDALNEDKSFLLFAELQLGQFTSSMLLTDLWRKSNFVPQSLHLYSKIGIFSPYICSEFQPTLDTIFKYRIQKISEKLFEGWLSGWTFQIMVFLIIFRKHIKEQLCFANNAGQNWMMMTGSVPNAEPQHHLPGQKKSPFTIHAFRLLLPDLFSFHGLPLPLLFRYRYL
jgi:hypothetical protein